MGYTGDTYLSPCSQGQWCGRSIHAPVPVSDDQLLHAVQLLVSLPSGVQVRATDLQLPTALGPHRPGLPLRSKVNTFHQGACLERYGSLLRAASLCVGHATPGGGDPTQGS
jgi:hypothetical protein